MILFNFEQGHSNRTSKHKAAFSWNPKLRVEAVVLFLDFLDSFRDWQPKMLQTCACHGNFNKNIRTKISNVTRKNMFLASFTFLHSGLLWRSIDYWSWRDLARACQSAERVWDWRASGLGNNPEKAKWQTGKGAKRNLCIYINDHECSSIETYRNCLNMYEPHSQDP